MCCPTLGVFMALNILKRQFKGLLDLSYEQPLGDSAETQPSLTYCDGGCYEIRYPRETMLNPCLCCQRGDTDGSKILQRFLFTICIVWDCIEYSYSRPRSPKCNNSLPTSLILVLWLLSFMSLYYNFMCVLVYLHVYVLTENEYGAFPPLALWLIRIFLIFNMNCVF